MSDTAMEVTPAKGFQRTSQFKSVMLKGQRCTIRNANFETISRIIMVSKVSATREAVLLLWFLKGRDCHTACAFLLMSHIPRTALPLYCHQTPF
eukprot:IDg3920t1